MASRVLTSLLALYLVALAAANLSCMDRSNNAVPWFTLIKYPGNVTTGSARYAYLDPSLGSQYQIVYGAHADDKGEALPNTIEAINYIPEADLNLIVYNDEPPGVPWDPYGAHAKGMIAFDNKTQTGVYIMHSFPKFPNVSADDGYIRYDLPSNTYTYGQNAYCISLDADSFGNLLNNLPVEWPNAYYSSGLFNSIVLSSDLPHATTQFNLLTGENQWFLTKSPNFTGFLYEDVIAPYFNVPLAVESWGRPYQDPACPPSSPVTTVNIDRIALNSQDTWDHYSDHAKWAISIGGDTNIACFCDMNRMDSQEVRGGSCLCNDNPSIYEALMNIIVITDKCQA